jgi:hypothetical protein
MSLEIATTMKLSLSDYGESRWGWIRLGNDASVINRSVRESKNNRCYASSQHHGGVGGVGMLRNVIEANREILTDGMNSKEVKPTHTTNLYDKSVLVCEEVGGVHSSDDGFVMKLVAKGPYLVDVNSEARACASGGSSADGLALTVLDRKRRCDG